MPGTDKEVFPYQCPAFYDRYFYAYSPCLSIKRPTFPYSSSTETTPSAVETTVMSLSWESFLGS